MNFVSAWPSPRIQGEASNGFDNWTDSVTLPNDGKQVPNSGDPRAVTSFVGASDVGIQWNSSNMWDAGSESDSDQQLYRVYLDDGDAPSVANGLGVAGDGIGVAVQVTGLSNWLNRVGATSYRLYVYRATDNATAFSNVDIRDGVALGSPIAATLTTLAGEGNGDYPTGGSIPPGAAPRRGYMVSDPLSLDTFTLTLPKRNSAIRGTLAGIGIEANPVPEPATMVLLGTGVAALLARRRK